MGIRTQCENAAVQSLATEQAIVDGSIVTFERMNGYRPFPTGRKVDQRLAYNVEIRDDKIEQKIVFDTGHTV
ncbi:MAG: hypothetical protein ACM3SP_25155 [Chloroflexota bacterium]